jgi:hypothetical protein
MAIKNNLECNFKTLKEKENRVLLGREKKREVRKSDSKKE